MATNEERITALEVENEHLTATLDEVRDDVREIRNAVERARGGWAVISLGLGAAGVIGGLITKYVLKG